MLMEISKTIMIILGVILVLGASSLVVSFLFKFIFSNFGRIFSISDRHGEVKINTSFGESNYIYVEHIKREVYSILYKKYSGNVTFSLIDKAINDVKRKLGYDFSDRDAVITEVFKLADKYCKDDIEFKRKLLEFDTTDSRPSFKEDKFIQPKIYG